MAESSQRAGRGGYLVALGLLAVGFAIFAAAVVPASREVAVAVEGLDRFVARGPGPVGVFEVDAPGRTRIGYESITRVEGEAFATEITWEPVLGLTGPGGEEVPLVEPNGDPEDPDNSTIVYRVDGRAGHTLAVADLPAAGRYELRVVEVGLAGDAFAETIGPATERRRVLAVGNVPAGLLKDGLLGVYGAAVAMGLLGCIAILVALITWARRHGTRTERVDGQPAAWGR